MLNEFAQQLLDGKTVPQTIRCGDERCFSLLKDLCAKTGIRLEKTDDPEALNDVIVDLLDHLAGEEDAELDPKEVEEMFDVLMQMPDSEFRQMPQELVNMLFSLSEAGALPDALDSRIRKLFRRKK